SDFLLEEVDAFLAVEDEPTSSEFYQPYLDLEGDILLLEAFLNDDPSPPPNQRNYMPKVRKELKIYLGASINLMPYSVWKRLLLFDLTPTCITLELADRSITSLVGIAEDVYVKVGSFHYPADFVVVDFDADPRVPLILERSFLKTKKALIDVFEGELTLRVGKEAITFNLDQTSPYIIHLLSC
nr:reverse transcriptase domain-containing protein [Tanacetum cinerariifolium]